MRRKFLMLSVVSALSLSARPDSIPEVIRRVDVMSDPLVAMAGYTGPVWYQWMSDVSLSDVGIMYADESRDAALDPQLGEGEDYWRFGASSYMKHSSSTLWGAAAYANGHQRNVKYNESADIDLIYPYVTADTVGGDMSLERYSFSGGYADHRGPWSWGAELSYKAGLYYRNVDPRPRNVTGLFDISAGVGRKVWRDYDLSVALSLRRYTQSQDIMFKSEMGQEKIYHLTGLGHHYNRFVGQGFSSHYGGYRYGAMVCFYPRTRCGLAVDAEVAKFKFDKVLNDLNALPLVSAWHNSLTTNISWLHPGSMHDWAFHASFDSYRRHGSENIFGDASSNIYPQICTLEMYADNHYGFSAEALYCYHTSIFRLWMKPSFGYSHRREIYVDPPVERLDEYRYLACESGACGMVGKWRAEASVAWHEVQHYGSLFTPSVALYRAISSAYALRAECRSTLSRDYKSLFLSVGLSF